MINEGDAAADYIEGLLDICSIDGDIDIEDRNDRCYITVATESSPIESELSKPETVQALQELTRLAVHLKTGEFSRVILDIGGSRVQRETELSHLVDRAIQKIEEGASSAALPALSSYERKLIHDFVSDRGYKSVSEGESKDRHTVIFPVS